MIEIKKLSREDTLLDILLDVKDMLVPLGRIVAFVVEGSLEGLAYAVVADWVVVDFSQQFERVVVQADRARAWRGVHGERVYAG